MICLKDTNSQLRLGVDTATGLPALLLAIPEIGLNN